MRIDVASDLGRHCRLGVVLLEPLEVRPSGSGLREKMRTAGETVRAHYAGQQPGSIERATAVRSMYRALHVDPHHTRASSEALLRRILRGDELPAINCIVDAANLWSLTTLCPVGLYDANRLSGNVVFRLGEQGCGYEGIRKDWVNLSDRPVLVDETGPFGNPTSDSLRTAVTEATASLFAVAFQPPSFPESEVAGLEGELKGTQENIE